MTGCPASALGSRRPVEEDVLECGAPADCERSREDGRFAEARDLYPRRERNPLREESPDPPEQKISVHPDSASEYDHCNIADGCHRDDVERDAARLFLDRLVCQLIACAGCGEDCRRIVGW